MYWFLELIRSAANTNNRSCFLSSIVTVTLGYWQDLGIRLEPAISFLFYSYLPQNSCSHAECITTTLLNFAGFYFIPGALSIDEQCYWIRESLNTFPQPPNRTNLTAIYGSISDLFVAAKKQKVLVEVNSADDQETNEHNNIVGKTQTRNFKFAEDSEFEKGGACKSIAATTLVRKLRWSTLGLQFDWSKVCILFFVNKSMYTFAFMSMLISISVFSFFLWLQFILIGRNNILIYDIIKIISFLFRKHANMFSLLASLLKFIILSIFN